MSSYIFFDHFITNPKIDLPKCAKDDYTDTYNKKGIDPDTCEKVCHIVSTYAQEENKHFFIVSGFFKLLRCLGLNSSWNAVKKEVTRLILDNSPSETLEIRHTPEYLKIYQKAMGSLLNQNIDLILNGERCVVLDPKK